MKDWRNVEQAKIRDSAETGDKQTADKLEWVARAGRRIRLTLLAFAIAAIGMFGFNSFLSHELGARLKPMLDALHDVNNDIVTSHLWLQEHLAKAELAGLDDVLWHLQQADNRIQEVLDSGHFYLVPFTDIPDRDMETHWKLLDEKVRQLREVTSRRIANSLHPGTTAEAGAEYDNVLRDVVSFTNHLEASVRNRITQNIGRVQALQFVIVGVFLLLAGYGAWFINRNFRHLTKEVHRRYLVENQLKCSRDKLKEAAAAKDQLLGKVSHEVRTPVNAILGLATILEGTKLNTTQRKYLRLLESETHILWRIMDDLLDFSKLECKTLTINESTIDLRRIIADAVELNLADAEAKNILLDADLPLDFPDYLLGDGVRLRQVVLNLLSNAVKFTSQGTVTAGVRGEALGERKWSLEFWVSDSGMGIPSEKHHHVFEPFAQGDDSTTRQFGGTGLGLAICKELVSLMGGSIDFDSDPINGTRFWVKLSLPLTGLPDDVGASRRLNGDHVLVVDRADSIRERTCALVEQLGATVTATDDPSAVPRLLVEAIDGEQPVRSLLVAERVSETGLSDVVRRVRGDERFVNVQIILITSTSARANQIGESMPGILGVVDTPHRVLDLPPLLLQQSNQDDAVPVSDTKTIDETMPFLVGKEVLLVDDHPVAQIVGRYMLETLGCRVDSAYNGREALELWQEHHYDAVFLDWQMPDIDGLDVAAEIRRVEQREKLPHTYLIAMTANAVSGDRERCLAAGMDEYVSKPATRERLVRVLTRLDDSRIPAENDKVAG